MGVTSMEWSPQQDRALVLIDKWLKNPDQQVLRLFGYAGTGKTTLAKHAANSAVGEVLFAAPTGKAAYVMQQKGCEGATTVHSLIYHTKEKGKAKLKDMEAQIIQLRQQLTIEGLSPEAIEDFPRVKEIRDMILVERENLSRPSFQLNSDSHVRTAGLVILDEGSMVDEQMGSDLLSFKTKVLVLGDEAQLPPVGGAGFFVNGTKPDIMLDEIHRQAAGNPIIELATRVRLGQSLPLGQYGNSKIIDINDVNKEDIMSSDQLIVGKNATRFEYNKRVRELLELNSEYPEVGDKLVCLRNNHELGLLNGALWKVTDVGQTDPDRTIMSMVPQEGGDELMCEVHSHHFLGTADQLPYWERTEAEEFDYGYALTCHKAQGSQWDNITVFDESYCFRKDKHRWLYTAITRAAEQLTLVRM